MLVVQRFRQSTHARDRDFRFLQQGDPLFTGEVPKARLNDVPQLWQTLFPESHRRVAWIVDKFCNANRVAEALPPPFIHNRDENITILQSIEPRYIVPRPIADAYRQTLRREEFDGLHEHQRGQRVDHRRIDVLALSRPLLHSECAVDAERRLERRDQIRDVKANPHRWPVRIAVHVHDAGHRLDLLVVRRQILVGTRLAITGDRAIDDARIDG
jgi:hypothetical protein